MLYLAALTMHAFLRLPLDRWLAPEMPVAAAFALVTLAALYLALHRRAERRRGWSKARSVRWLRSLGLRVPPGQVLRSADPAHLARAARRIGLPAIFRSNELGHENRSADTMGAHDSVVVRTPEDLARLPAAWRAMAGTPGARPSFLVQPYCAFESSGVVQLGLVHNGQPQVRIEWSQVPEGVTGNRADAVCSRCLDIDACLCSDDALLRDVARIHAADARPLLLEFGLLGGRPVWLQAQPLAHSDLLLYAGAEAKGFALSALNAEFSADSVGRPLLLSLMNRAIPFQQWRLQEGRIHERRLGGYAVCAGLARCVPWPVWLRLSAFMLRRSRAAFHAGRDRPGAGNGWKLLRWLLLLDGLAVARGAGDAVVRYRPDASAERELAAVVSPYGQFAQLPQLILPASTDANPAQVAACRQRAGFVVRERLRQAIAYALALPSARLQALLAKEHLPPQTLDALGWTDVDWRRAAVRPNPAFFVDIASPAQGLKDPGPVRIQVERPAQIEPVRLELERAGVRNAVVTAVQPWLGLFALASHVAQFRILGPVHRTSHFMQRARALGIGVQAAAQPNDLSSTSSKEFS